MNKFKADVAVVLGVIIYLFTFSNANFVKVLKDRNDLEIAKKYPGGNVVYFGKTKFGRAEMGVEHKRFFKNFERAAKALKDYRVNFYQIECTVVQTDLETECGDGKGKVIVYSNSVQDEFDLSLMFDENHIVGHVLFQILQQEITIAQDKFMWADILERSKGKKDIVLLYTNGIGDADQRYFVEAAFVYGKEYQFVITTEASMPGVTEKGSLWYYNCKNVTGSENCKFRLKKQAPRNVLDVLRFLKQEGMPRIVEMNEDGSSSFDKMDDSLPINKVYLFDNDLNNIEKLAKNVVKQIDSGFSFILVKVDKHAAHLEKFGVHEDTVLPYLVLQPAQLLGSHEDYYEQWLIDAEFNQNNIVSYLNEYYESPNTAYKSIANVVNIEYDTVSSWKKPKEGLWIIGGCMQELGDCNSFRIVFRRVARSIVHSPLEFDCRIAYVDFTGRPDDAQLNTLPGLMVSKDNEEIKYSGPVDYKSIMDFLRINFSPSIMSFPLSGSDHMPIGPSEDEIPEDEDAFSQKELLSMEDDVMSKIAVDAVKKIDDDNVLDLTDKTFNETKDKNDLMVTLFFLPWCVKSIILRGSYAKVVHDIEKTKSENMISSSVNKVNCFDWEDVCKKQGVFTYPLIKIYRKGLDPITYTGSLDIKTLKNTIRLLQDPVVKELTDVQSFNHFTDVSDQSVKFASASVLGLFNTENDKELKTFKNVAEDMFGKYSFGFVAGNIARQSAQTMKAALPSFMVLKRNDPAETMIKSDDFQNMKKFVEEHVLPTYGELTAINFPKYIAFEKPFIINFKNRTDSFMEKTLQTLSKKTNAVFVTWMDIDKTVTREIMTQYLEDASSFSSVVVLVNHKKGKVYKYDGGDDAEELLKWSNNCLAKRISPVATLENKEWKPLREGYNYLQFIKEQGQKKDENAETVEEVDESVTVTSGDDDNDDERDRPAEEDRSNARDEL